MAAPIFDPKDLTERTGVAGIVTSVTSHLPRKTDTLAAWILPSTMPLLCPCTSKNSRWPRHKIDVPVRAVFNKPDRILDGRGMEMSEGGICLLMDAELGLGDKIELEFTPPYSGKRSTRLNSSHL